MLTVFNCSNELAEQVGQARLTEEELLMLQEQLFAKLVQGPSWSAVSMALDNR